VVSLVHSAVGLAPSSRTSVTIRSAPSVSTGAPLTSVLESLPSLISSQSEAKDVCVTLEVQLHIALEVVAQLDKAKDFRWLLLEKLSLREFLVEQISSLRMVFEVQDDAPSWTQASMSSPQVSVAPAHVPLPSQPEVEDECFKPEVLLCITFEVIFQLDKAA
jgi:hypothetical protein